jgi:hypothetical protein
MKQLTTYNLQLTKLKVLILFILFSTSIFAQDDISATAAFVKITNLNTGVSDNYLIDLSKTYKTINLSSKPTGQYIVNLVTDNVIVDTKQLIKN